MDEDDAFLYGDGGNNSNSNKPAPNSTTTIEAKDGQHVEDSKKKSGEEDEEDEEDEDEDDDDNNSSHGLSDSSDSDVEFIIGSLESKPKEVEEDGGAKVSEPESSGTTEQTGSKPQTVGVLKETHGLDLKQVGKFNGVPVNELTLDELKDKPWRQPGADISDYFNYGFDELSWLAYCKKQNTLRKDFNPAKVMAELMASSGMPAGQPPFMMGPMGMPPFMGGMPPPNMGMPPNSNPSNSNVNRSRTNIKSNIPNMPKLPSRPMAGGKPVEPTGPRSMRNYRDRSDRSTEMRSGRASGQKYRDRSSRRR